MDACFFILGLVRKLEGSSFALTVVTVRPFFFTGSWLRKMLCKCYMDHRKLQGISFQKKKKKKRVLDQVTKKRKVQIKEAETKHFQQGTVNKRLISYFLETLR